MDCSIIPIHRRYANDAGADEPAGDYDGASGACPTIQGGTAASAPAAWPGQAPHEAADAALAQAPDAPGQV